MAKKQIYRMKMPNGKIYQFRGTLEAAQQRAKIKGYTPIGFNSGQASQSTGGEEQQAGTTEQKQMYQVKMPDGTRNQYYVTPDKIQEILSQSGYSMWEGESEPSKEPEEGPKPPEEPEDETPSDPANIIDDAGELIIPQELQDDPYFTQLDPDMQAMAIYSWNITQTEQVASEAETKAYQDAFLEAIDEATLQSNPYFAEQLRMIKDEFQRTIGTLSDDLASVERTIATHKAQIEEDLEYNKDQITVEQQAELSRREKEYKVQLDSTREQMAQKGLSFSSIRTQAEEKLGVAQKDIIESTERRYARQLRSLTVGSERGLEGLVTQLEESRRKTEEAKTSATRGAEKQIGSELLDLPETEQYELGGIYGAPWQKMKQEDIFTRAQNILKLEFPSL